MADYVGQKCAGCGKTIEITEAVAVCSECNTAYHKHCWDGLEKCCKCNLPITDVKVEIIPARAVENLKGMETENQTAVSAIDIQRYNDSSILFSNIGGKIKTLATVIAVAGMGLGVLFMIALVFVDEDFIVSGLLAAVAMILVSWISSFTLYGFGSLIACTQASTNLLSKILNQLGQSK